MIPVRRLMGGILLASVVFVLAGPDATADAPRPLAAQGTLQPAFAPWDDIDALLVETIAGAQRRVLVQAYLFTSKNVSAALIAAHRRGVDVQLLLDARQLERVPSSSASALSAAGIPVWLETKYQNAHNKVIIVDPGSGRPVVVTGSYNFTWTAQHRNAENILIARDNPQLAIRYADNWERHRLDATPFKP